MIPPLLALALLQAPTSVDEGTFIVRDDTAEVARESFRLAHGRLARGGIGWTLATTIRYDRARPVVVLAPILEVSADTLPATLQYDVADPREPVRILGELGRGRFTVRFVARDTERAREFPAGGRPVVLDDSVFALYLFAAWRASPGPSPVTAIVPRGLRRDAVQIQDHGLAPTTLNRAATTLRHVSVSGGPNQRVHLWLDPGGRLMKVEIPSRGVTAERAPAG
ncbi:MAG TPA: hypothetical protein VGQ06_06525 [Gemmatimonadales bacterium]|jgi:hypothetical protein|nr:hypothetical protein [Gemmatimonadales bacterium]